MEHRSPKDSPDSTVNVETMAPLRVPPLTLKGDRLSGAGSPGTTGGSLISRLSYNPKSNSYSHVLAPGGAGDSCKIRINVKNNSGSGESLSYAIQDDPSKTPSASPGLGRSSYGSQSRSQPVRNFLRPSASSKVYTSPAKDGLSPFGGLSDLRSSIEATPISSSYVTSRPPNQNKALKLHFKREVPSSASSASAENLSRAGITITKTSNFSILNRNISDSSISSSVGEMQISPINMSTLKSTKMPKLSSPVMQQLHPSLLKQLKQQSGKVMDLDIDDGRDNKFDVSQRKQPNSKSNFDQFLNINRQESGRKKMSVPVPVPSTITITIGDKGVISETGQMNCSPDSHDEAPGRTRRKRKPAKQFTPAVAIPPLKIRRKKDADEGEGTAQPGFSLVSNNEVKVNNELPAEDEQQVQVKTFKRQGRGRPRVSSPRQESPPKITATLRGRGRPRGSRTRGKAEATESPDKEVSPAPRLEDHPLENAEAMSSPEKQENDHPTDSNSIASVAASVMTQKEQELKEDVGEAESTVKKTRATRRTRANGGRRRAAQPRRARAKKAKPGVSLKQENLQKPSSVQVFEEETRMSADLKPPAPVPSSPAIPPVLDEESIGASNMSSTSTSVTGMKVKKFTKDLVPDRKPVTAETLFEYSWPQSDATDSEMYMLQEQVSEFLGVKSFKRKYPDIKRRPVDMHERDFVRSMNIVSETECDLGLTALCSSDVLDIMFNDFPEKFEEFNKVLQQRREIELAKLKGAAVTPVAPVRDRSKEFYRRCLKSAAKWNSLLNLQRKEERTCSFDLQTFTLHYPLGKMKVLPPEATKLGHYPTTVLPGQYSDYYKTYTPAELKYLPLNTVLYTPAIRMNGVNTTETGPKEIGSSSDSDSSSSSSDSDSSSSDDESDSEERMDSQANGLPDGSAGDFEEEAESTSKCKTCDGTNRKNKHGQSEPLLHCTKCDTPNHPTCLELRVDMLPFIKKYNWECTDCKNCIECNDPADEDKMLFCDLCDRGYHIYCIGLRKVPTGRWHCKVCAVCSSCGATQPSAEDRLAEWHHEFKKGDKNSRSFSHSLCVSCFKLYKKGQFCPSCFKVHLKIEENKGLAECLSCEKWVHKECITRPVHSFFGFRCDPCDSAFRERTKMPNLPS